jgi:hypothetical protein
MIGRNRVSTDFMEAICSSLQGGLVALETLDIRHMKEAGKVNWNKMLTSISALSKRGRVKPLTIRVSDY